MKMLVHRYFNSWQEPNNLKTMATCLSDDVIIDAGSFRFDNKKSFLAFISQNPTPWGNVQMLNEVYTSGKAAILYEGINQDSKYKMRVAEFISVNDNGLIKHIHSVITKID